MYNAGVIKRVEKSHDAVWEGLSPQGKGGALKARRVDAPGIQASNDIDPFSGSEKRFSLRTSIAILLGISLFLWYWLFQLGHYLLGVLVG
ncbi:MAG: hypothetical protein ACREX9_06025 [Gammaproteobacteria bacterium]